MKRIEVRMREAHESDYGYEYLRPYREKFPKKPVHEILELIFQEHERYKELVQDREQVVDAVSKQLKKDIRPAELRAGSAEKNTLVLLEIWNGWLFAHGQEGYKLTNEIYTTPLKRAVQKVSDDKDVYRKKKISREEHPAVEKIGE